MKISPDLQYLVASLQNPGVMNDPAIEVEVDPAINAVRSLEDPTDMLKFLKAYVKGRVKNDISESRESAGLFRSIFERRQVRETATNDAVGYVLTKALDSSPTSWHSTAWLSVAENSGLWPPREIEGSDYLDDDLYDDFSDL